MRCPTMPDRPFVHRLLGLFLLTLLSALPALGYRVYLRDGTMLAARERYTVDGDLAVMTLENGTRTTVRLAEIDVEKTERLNQRAYSSAVVIDGREERLLAIDDPAMQQRTLAEYVRERRLEREQREAAAADAEQARRPRIRRTPAGFLDLRTLERVADDDETSTKIADTVKRQGVSGARVYRGSAPGRYLVDVTAQSDVAVFEALDSLTAAVVELADAGIALDALEVYLANADGSRAGQFTLTEEIAALLASDQLEPDQFFVQFVEF